MTQVLEDLAPAEEPVSIKHRDGTVVNYVITELDEGDYCKYQNALSRTTRFGPDGQVSHLEGVGDSDIVLLSLSLKEVYQHRGEEQKRSVLELTVRSWNRQLCQTLIERTKDINKLNRDESPSSLREAIAKLQKRLEAAEARESQLKNLQSATDLTSS